MNRKKKMQRCRRIVIERDGYFCTYCGVEIPFEQITMDHIIPRAYNGADSATNLCVACKECNNNRGSEDFFTFANYVFMMDPVKYNKFLILRSLNIRINILNIAMETTSPDWKISPYESIDIVCDCLDIQTIEFNELFRINNIDPHANYSNNEMLNKFQILIHNIDSGRLDYIEERIKIVKDCVSLSKKI